MEAILTILFFTAILLIVIFTFIHFFYVKNIENRELYMKQYKRNGILFIVAALLIIATVILGLFQ
jgi:uncharacterized membrane protein YidH (DUF202 family)